MTAHLPPGLHAALQLHLQQRGLPDLQALADLAEPRPVGVGWRMDDLPGWWNERAAARLAAAVPLMYRDAEIGDADADTGRLIQQWLDAHERDPGRYPWLLLNGMTGRGKTHLAWAVLKQLVRQAAARQHTLTWQFVDNATLNAELRVRPDGSHNTAISKYLDADLTVFDDIGAGNISEYAIEGVLRILDYRLGHRAAMLLTSNLGGEQVRQILSDRVLSRLTAARRIQVDGPDRRAGMGWP